MTRWALACAALAPVLAAQRPPVDEFVHLEPVLRAAAARVAPSVVTVETFGGARRLLAGGARPQGDTPRDPREEEKEKEKKHDEEEKKPGEKKIGPLVQKGFLQAQGASTGVVLTADGWILVSRFALNFDPTTVLVTLPDGRSFHAERGGEDTSRGLALVKIEAEDLPVPEFVAPADIRVGQWAFALGRTFGRGDPSIHMGIVSAVGRQFGRALQTDAYTSPANYGGPLIDVDGRVLGISVPLSRSGRDAGAELYDSGIGFAATIPDITPLLERMKTGEVLHRGWLGVSTVPDDLGPGAAIAAVVPDSAAAEAGIEKNDTILSVDQTELANSFQLQSTVSSRMGGDRVRLEVQRGDERFAVEVTLADLPAAQRASKKPAEEAGELPWEEGDKKTPGR